VTSVACALLIAYGNRRFRSGVTLDWQVAGWLTVFGALVAVGLQIYQLTDLPFFPGSSGYASCFIGWAGFNIATLLVGGLLARDAACPGTAPPSCGCRGWGSTALSVAAARLFRANLEGATYFWGFIALLALFFWALFYVL